MKNLSIASGLALLASSFAFGQNQSTHFDFNDEESFMRQWTIIDANNDRQTWYWLDSAGVNNTGCVEVRTGNETEASNDYLITTSPIHLEQGESHMAFMLAARGAAWQEDLRLLYGKSTDTAEMEVIHEWTDFNNNTLEFHLIQFETKEAGDYYFAFHAVSDGKPSNGFRFDELTIGSGTFQGIPDLSITNVELPISSCQLGSEESVSATVSNPGTAEISSFRLSYTVNGSNPVNETFDQSIPVGGSLTVTFAQKADFSASGTYQVEVQGEVIPASGTQEESYLENNSGSDKTIHYLPTGTPFVTDFTQGLSENWDALNGTWVYNNKQQAIHAYADSILLSRCISLNEGIEYQFSILYKAGISLGYYERYGDFDIRYGLSGSPVAEWDTMASFREHYTYEKYVSFDLGLLSKYNYYTGIVFKAYTYGVGDAVAKGGRYDQLLGHFGKEAAAVGFVVLVDDLLEALSRQKRLPAVSADGILIVYEPDRFADALKLAKKQRAAGVPTELMPAKAGSLTDAWKVYRESAAAHQQGQILYLDAEGGTQNIAVK